MTRSQTLAIALVAAGMTASNCYAQQALSGLTSPAARPAQNLEIRYPVTPQAGEWLIFVQTFKGEQAQFLAEQMAEMIMKDHRLPAYVHVRGRQERAEEDERIRKLREQYDGMVKELQKQNPETQPAPFRYRFQRINEEFAVLIGGAKRFKDMDVAHDFLPKVRKLPMPPNEFCCPVELADLDANGKKMTPKGHGYLNPFLAAMVVHNPTIPFEKQQANPEIADDLLKMLNAGEDLSVLRCSKAYTLVAKVYQGPAILKPPEAPSLIHKLGVELGIVEKDLSTLNAQALKARELAEFLRKMKPPFESYVMHQSRYSIVTVGQYDSLTDPNLLANQRTLAGLQIKDSKTEMVLEQLDIQPPAMKIPR